VRQWGLRSIRLANNLAIDRLSILGIHVDLLVMCCRSSPVAALIAILLSIIHGIHSKSSVVSRAYGVGAHGARTGRAKPSALSLPSPTYTHASMP
jgi:hypothetical protein